MDSPSIQAVRAQFESLLLEPLLEPLESAFGGYGDIAVQSFSEALAKALSA
ncbi:MAG TPA: hypothetical protein VFN37_06935 [Candidatus Baltobacteraceae bacterium]|nr:hypothetical protein [Candidatus Baltobacteraceae bacterium]